MAKGKEGKGLGDREKQILFILVGLILVAAAYFLGFTKLKEKRDTFAAENATLEQEVEELRQMQANSAQVEADTEEKKNLLTDIYKNYPVEYRTQNFIDYFDKIEKLIRGLDIKSESFNANMIYFQNGALLESEVSSEEVPEAVAANGAAPGTTAEAPEETENPIGEDGLPKEVTAYHSSVSIAYETSYDNLKKIITHINQYPHRSNIGTISVSAGEGAKNLTCTMTVNLYSVKGIEGTYEDLSFPEVPIHKQNIFK